MCYCPTLCVCGASWTERCSERRARLLSKSLYFWASIRPPNLSRTSFTRSTRSSKDSKRSAIVPSDISSLTLTLYCLHQLLLPAAREKRSHSRSYISASANRHRPFSNGNTGIYLNLQIQIITQESLQSSFISIVMNAKALSIMINELRGRHIMT